MPREYDHESGYTIEVDVPANVYSEALERRREAGAFRRIRLFEPAQPGCITVDGKTLINLASNDYLGLSQHPNLKRRAAQFALKYGAGCGASRLMSGNLYIYEQLEEKLASLKGTEAALIFATGYQANNSVMAALFGKTDFVAFDRLCHHSLIQGINSSGARRVRFRHNDIPHLRSKLSTSEPYRSSWIITESIFGMDGDRAPLEELQQLALENSSGLFIDEAHATGVAGANGMGLVSAPPPATVVMGTFSKGLGSFGAYIACSRQFKQYLTNYAGGLIYSTALPPPVLGAIEAALELVPQMKQERLILSEQAEYLRHKLSACGFETGKSESCIVPLIVGSNQSALRLAEHLEKSGFFAPAIRPPTVPEGLSRIRFSLTINHTRSQIDQLLTTLKGWNERHN